MNYTDDQLFAIRENSFKNFHVKGFDYLCLNRTPDLTEKIYFFDGDVSKMPEVVNPHNHRYDFVTNVIAGAIRDIRYCEHPDSRSRYNRYNWRTPLNGGNGFEYDREVGLVSYQNIILDKGRPPFATYCDHIHTIQILRSETVIRLLQLKDRYPLSAPSQTYFLDGPPSLDGLYEKFTMDELIKRLALYKRLTGGALA